MFQGYDLKHFFKFIIPSILAFTILGVYSVGDGFFMGNALGGVTYATYFMVIVFIMNSVLDYVLIMIFPFGIHGAAIATLLSQAVTIVGCIYYIKQHQMLKLSKPVNVQKTSLKIMKIGIAQFGINMSPMVSIFFMNAIHFIMAEL